MPTALADQARAPAARQNPTPQKRYHLVIFGAGTAGQAAARIAAALGVRVALIERYPALDGRFNTGPVLPSKALIRTSRLYAEMRDAKRYGAQTPQQIDVDFAAAMERVRRIGTHIKGDETAERLSAAGVDVFFGEARFTGPDTFEIDGQQAHFRRALIATGARPNTSLIPGLEEAGYYTSNDIFNITELPRRLVVIGGGPLGCELAQAFCRLGAHTTIVEEKPLFLGGEERDAAQLLSNSFVRDGIRVCLNTSAVAVHMEGGQTRGHKLVDLICDENKYTIAADAILTGIGRSPNVQDMNLEAANVQYDADNGVHVDDYLQTTNPRIYAAGDVCLGEKYSHTAAASARVVVRNALMHGREQFSKLVIPWCTFTDPEIAHVGMYVREANLKNIPIKTFTVPMHQVDRAVTDSEDEGFVKIHVREGTDQILGATIVATHAGDMINEITLAMVAGIGLRTLSRVIHAYPTQAEAIKMAADAYNRTRLTRRIQMRLHRLLSW